MCYKYDPCPKPDAAAASARTQELTANPEGLAEMLPIKRSPWDRLMDWLFGRDFFISYCWRDGRDYAVKLAEKLKKERFDCFLDSEGFIKGDNFRWIGDRELGKTSRLVLVGSPEVHQSEEVERELRVFGEKQGRIIAIEFGDSLSPDRFPESPVIKRIDRNVIRQVEPADALGSEPSDMVIAELKRTFDVETTARRRLRAVQITAVVLFVLLVLAGTAAFQEQRQRKIAERGAEQMRLLMDAANTREQLRSAPRAMAERTLDLHDRALSLFDEPPAELLKTASEVWMKGREIGRTRMEALETVGSFDWILPGFGFSRSGDAIRVDLGAVEHELLDDGARDSVMVWEFEKGKGSGRNPSDREFQDSHDGRRSMLDPYQSVVIHDRSPREGSLTVRLSEGRVIVAGGSSPESVVHHDDGINVALVAGVNDSLLITAGGRAFDVDGRITHDPVIRFWRIESSGDVRKLETELHGHERGVIALALHSERKLLASMDETGTLVLWDIEGVDQPLRLGEPRMEAVGGARYSVASNSDGTRISTVGYYGAGNIYRLDGSVVARFQGNHESGYLASLPGREGFVTNADEALQVFDWDGRLLDQTPAMSGRMDQVRTVAFSPDGRMKAWCDSQNVWCCGAWRDPSLLSRLAIKDERAAEEGYLDCGFSGDTALLVSLRNGNFEIWDPHQRLRNATVKVAGGPFSFAPRPGATGEIVVSAGADLTFGRLEKGEWSVVMTVTRTSGVSCLEVSRDGRILGVGRDDGVVELWDLPSRSLIRALGRNHFGYVSDLEFSPDGDRLYSSSRDGTVLVHEAISFSRQMSDLKLRRNLPALLGSRPSIRPEERSEPEGIIRQFSRQTEPKGHIVMPSWILCCECPEAEGEAKRLVDAWKAKGFPSSYLWIPDYPSLSGKELWLVFVGPFDYDDKADARSTLEKVRTHRPSAYGLKLDESAPREMLE